MKIVLNKKIEKIYV